MTDLLANYEIMLIVVMFAMGYIGGRGNIPISEVSFNPHNEIHKRVHGIDYKGYISTHIRWKVWGTEHKLVDRNDFT
jgi:hypothetical protein